MSNYIDVNLAAYDTLSGAYGNKIKKYIDKDKDTSSIFRSKLEANFKVARVLELGVGSGLTLSNFENEGYETIGIDFSQKMIEVAKKVASKTKFLLGDFLTYDFNKIKYSGIYAQAFIHLFPKEDAKKVLKKIFDLLESNGVAHISTTVHEVFEEGYLEKFDYKGNIKRFRKKWDENDLLKEIENVGFKIYKKHYITEPDNGKKWIIIVVVKK